jgi:hypothetical protein
MAYEGTALAQDSALFLLAGPMMMLNSKPMTIITPVILIQSLSPSECGKVIVRTSSHLFIPLCPRLSVLDAPSLPFSPSHRSPYFLSVLSCHVHGSRRMCAHTE